MSLNHFSSSELQETLWWHQHQQLPLMEPTQNVNDSSPKRHRAQNPQHQHQHQHQQYASNWPPHYFYFNSFNSQESPPPPPPLPLFHPTTHPNLNFNRNHQNDAADDESSPRQPQVNDPHNPQQQMEEYYKEPMFEKPLTPSDVGKLNRLVIPKQYAEKYFPLGGTDSSGEKGLLLSFEDESGKFWRFRYSYWNSSQSYVLTKGWSRYVKEKRLDAGDVILFERHRAEADRLFIGWRRRGGGTASQEGGNGGGGWNRGMMNSGTGQLSYPKDVTGTGVTTVPYQPDCLHAGSGVAAQSQTGNNSKTLRLFGVNMECQMEESEPSTPDGSSSSASSYGQAAAVAAHHHPQAQQYFYHHPQPQAYSSSSNRHNHMDITFSQDVNQMMRNHQR